MDASALRLLSRSAGLDLEIYRDTHVARRIGEALARTESPDVVALHDRLCSDAEARVRFRRSIAISVSGPFRDPEQFEILARELEGLVRDTRLLVWSAGCADGSELWSVAVLLDRLGALDRSLLLGSDVLEENVARARQGAGVPEGMRRLPPSTRVRFERRDIVNDGAPAGKWNVILCRNVAIYFTREARSALHATLAEALAPDGLLMLGRSERLSDARGLGLRLVAPHTYRRSA